MKNKLPFIERYFPKHNYFIDERMNIEKSIRVCSSHTSHNLGRDGGLRIGI